MAHDPRHWAFRGQTLPLAMQIPSLRLWVALRQGERARGLSKCWRADVLEHSPVYLCVAELFLSRSDDLAQDDSLMTSWMHMFYCVSYGGAEWRLIVLLGSSSF